MLNNSLLTKYASKFLGYGKWESPIWFIGIEEAGGETEPEVALRLQTWSQRGERALENVHEFYAALGHCQWQGEQAILQPTWAGLIRILLLARGEIDSHQNIRQYQRERIGDLCLTELLALPSPTTDEWKYVEWSELDLLKSRRACLQATSPTRILALKQQLHAKKPRAVIFYGTTIPEGSLFPYWAKIAETDFVQGVADEKLFKWGANESTAFFVIPHPSRAKIEVVRRIGKSLLENHAARFRR
jgi:hypothetical protein